MPDKEIVQLDPIISLSDDDLLLIVDNPASSNITGKITVANAFEYLTKGNLTATSPIVLSQTRQVIGGAAAVSIPVATTSIDGYLAAADWTTFNNKQAALSFPLAATLGGTGVNNAGTLTLATDASITGGGTLALAGYTLTVANTASVSGTNTGDVTLAANHGLGLTNQVLAMGTPSTLTSSTTNAVTTTTHTHAITGAPALLGNGAMQYQTIITGATPFAPVYSGFLLDGTTGGKTVFAVSNTKTLTLTSTGNFNLTIPKSGTVALLATANIFTAAQFIADGTSLSVSSYKGANAAGDNFFIGGGGTFSSATAGSSWEGSYNFTMGGYALYSLTKGFSNVAIGNSSLQNISTGNQNIGLGANAGRWITGGVIGNQTSTLSIYFGLGTKALADGDTNEIVIGMNAVGFGSNTATLGNTAITATYLNGSTLITGNSDLVQLIIKANATQTSNIFETQKSNAAVQISFDDNGGAIFNEAGNATGDHRIESDTYDALFVDASNDSVMIMSNVAGKVGFYGKTAIAQQTHIVDADGTLADATTKINAILVRLETLGLIASA